MGKTTKKVRIFSALEVANLCGVVNQTAINWIRNGHLKAFTTPGGQYRIYAEDLSAFLIDRGMRLPEVLLNGQRPDVDWSSILIVDDDRQVNDLLKRFLDTEIPSFTIFQAFDGFEAGAFIAEQRPGFVILDLDLPGIDGFQICHRIKTDPAFGKPFVFAITGFDSPDAQARILEAGADAFMGKPLDMDAMVGVINDFMEKVRENDGR